MPGYPTLPGVEAGPGNELARRRRGAADNRSDGEENGTDG